ncbi:probable elastin-binding protein EbpS isoform X3 [Bactrocera neohumeralis]|uniref:probable elastin-binding protein EbpS isoform X3 n=1 Tax=Bactrocera neohumeralis TaxID=98809 RepID=UPI0021653909|nr:probable elastin-binding protein EbpS isoform X3 [Bactrocera neohumeralis]
MKPQTLCLSVLIVSFLLIADIPRVLGVSLNYEWLGLAENVLLDLIRSIINSINYILQGRLTPQMIEEKIDVSNLPGKDGSQSRESNSQETGTTDENKETDNSAEKNGSESGSNTDEDKNTDNSAEKNGSERGGNTDEAKNTDNSVEKNGSESGGNTDEDKYTDNSAEKNTSEGGDNSRDTKESSENRLSTVINLENFLKSLTKNLKGCKLKQSKNKNKSNTEIVCRW